MKNNVEYREENGFLITNETGFPSNTFQIVSAVPAGYFIWNIGDHAPEGWLPLCRLSTVQPFEGGRSIESFSLKIIKCDGSKFMLKAASLGFDTLAKAETFLTKHQKTKGKQIEMNIIAEALPYMKIIKWN